MKRRILTYGGYFEAFMETLKEKSKRKSSTDFFYLKHKTACLRNSSS